MFVDTHTHLYLDDFLPSRETIVENAFAAGVEKLIFPNVDLTTIGPMNDLRDRFPDKIFMAMGLHPTEIGAAWEADLAKIESELSASIEKYVAIGEIGIDLYWDRSYREQQLIAFSRQVDWAISRDLPVIIHCRDGLDEILTVLTEKAGKVRGVFHSFGGTAEDVRRIRETGDFYFGINGIVTFKNSKLGDTLPEIGLDRILLETDSPYLAPVPYRGKECVPYYVKETFKEIQKILNIEETELCDTIFNNSKKFFS